VGGGDDGLIAMHDAARAELLEAGPDLLLAGVRLAVRLDDARMEAFGRRLRELIAEAKAWDAEGGTPIAVYIVAHRRPAATHEGGAGADTNGPEPADRDGSGTRTPPGGS
jgi:hypothetical protein